MRENPLISPLQGISLPINRVRTGDSSVFYAQNSLGSDVTRLMGNDMLYEKGGILSLPPKPAFAQVGRRCVRREGPGGFFQYKVHLVHKQIEDIIELPDHTDNQ